MVKPENEVKIMNAEDLYLFLKEVDMDFPVPISKKQDLIEYSEKLFKKATLCAKYDDGKIISLVAGYTENLTDDMAYIAIVATAKVGRGLGLAPKLVKEFISICKAKNIVAVHLYTDKQNEVAVKMYEEIGFLPYKAENELRPYDMHLIYYIRK